MPDYSFIAQPKTSEGVQTLGSLVNTAGGLQNLQRGAVELGKARALLQPDIACRQAESNKAQTEANHAQFRLTGDQNSAAMSLAGGALQDPRLQKPDGVIEIGNELYGQMVERGIPKGTADFWASQLK